MFGPCNTISQLSRKASSICVPRKRVAQGRWRGKRGEDCRGGEGIKCAKRSWNCSILKIEHGKERRRRKKFTGRLSQGSCSIHDVKCKENTRELGQREERQNRTFFEGQNSVTLIFLGMNRAGSTGGPNWQSCLLEANAIST